VLLVGTLCVACRYIVCCLCGYIVCCLLVWTLCVACLSVHCVLLVGTLCVACVGTLCVACWYIVCCLCGYIVLLACLYIVCCLSVHCVLLVCTFLYWIVIPGPWSVFSFEKTHQYIHCGVLTLCRFLLIHTATTIHVILPPCKLRFLYTAQVTSAWDGAVHVHALLPSARHTSSPGRFSGRRASVRTCVCV